MNHFLRLTIGLLFIADTLCGQKMLQLEKLHSAQTRKYFPGDEITFQLKGGQWYTRVIEDVSWEQNLVFFSQGHVKVEDITAFRSFNNRKWSRPVGNQLFNFAIAWTGFSLIADAFSNDPGDTYGKEDAIIAGTSVALGIGIKKLFKRRTFHFRKNKKGEDVRWRLRILDLRVKVD
jgi:hypothetical protein